MSDVGDSVPGPTIEVHFPPYNSIPIESLPELPGVVLGIDVSHHNTVTDWGAVKGAGIDFVMVRVSHGISLDRRFREHLQGARNVGLVVGCYHYFEAADCYRDGGMPMAQARTFVDAVRVAGLANEPGVLPPVLDAEEGAIEAGDLLLWLSDVKVALMLTPWVYTNRSWWKSHIGPDTRFSKYPAWIADWTPPLEIPLPWRDVIMWQHTNVGRVPGINGNVDLNRFNGSLETLRWMAGL